MNHTPLPRDPAQPPPSAERLLDGALAEPGTYVLLQGTSLDGRTDYLLRYWPAEGTAQLDARDALDPWATWTPVATDLVAETVPGEVAS